MKKIFALIIMLLLVATSASAIMVAGVMSSYRPPQPPNAPTGVTATAGSGQNTVNWTDGTGPGSPATSYTLYGGTTASPTASIYNGPATTYTHTPLVNGTPYYYRLTASNAVGTSGYSSPDATATPGTYGFESGTLSPFTAGGTTAISTAYAHGGTKSVLIPGITPAGNGTNLAKSTTLPASGTVTVSRWFMVHGTIAATGYGVVYGLGNDASASTWLSTTFVYFGSTQGNSLSGGTNGEGLYTFGNNMTPNMATWIGALSKDVWYKLVVNLDVTNSKRSFAVYDTGGSLVYGNLSTYAIGQGGTGSGATYPNLSFYDTAYTSSAGTSFGLYLDDIYTGGL